MSAKHFLFCLVVLLALLTPPACAGRPPILIGLAVELTGKQADVGINIRDAAQMAVDEVNTRGGVDGRPLELVIRDDEGKPEVAQAVDAELIELGVVAIMGHYTSTVAAAVIGQMNAAKIVLISPTASSAAFSGKDDYFLRLIPDTNFIGQQMGKHIYEDHQLKRLVGVYDDNNRTYAKAYWEALSTVFTQMGGETQVVVFNSSQTEMKALATQVASAQPEGVVIVASAVDTAILAQYLRQAGMESPLFSSSWAQTSQLIEKGGQAVEGLEISTVYNPYNQFESHQEFNRKFEVRFSRQPLLGTSQAYEIVMVLAAALQKTGGKADGLLQALLETRDFPGIEGLITFDEFGDVHRDVYLMKVENGQLQEKEIIKESMP